jgi:signal transduction histidine kinase
MRRLVDQIVDLARMQMGQELELDRRPTDLVAVAHRVAAEHQAAAPRHAVRVEATDDVVGDWDAARLERAVDNLVGNAVKYSPEGGEVLVRVRPGGDGWAEVSVADSGVGIPAADLATVFDRFRRASNSRGFVGSGIGLASVRQIVHEHGGEVSVASTEGQGSTFTMRLPLRQEDAPP